MKNPANVKAFLGAMESARATDWDQMGHIMHQQALENFGSQTGSGNDWFDANRLLPLLEVKRKALLRHNQAATRASLASLREARRCVQRETRRCANDYWSGLCEKIQVAADTGNLQGMYAGIRNAVGPARNKVAPLKDLEGNLITDRDRQLQRWTEHYGGLYGTEPQVDFHAINQIPALPCRTDLDSVPSLSELQNAISRLSKIGRAHV